MCLRLWGGAGCEPNQSRTHRADTGCGQTLAEPLAPVEGGSPHLGSRLALFSTSLL
jgi:hypothetical protein